MMNWLRRIFGLHIHEWTDWERYGEITLEKRIIGKVQQRQCQTCKITQWHKEYIY